MRNSKSARRTSELAVGALIVALSIVVHIRGVANGFVNYDDGRFVTKNAVVQEGLTWRGVAWAFTTNTEVYFIPITWITHIVDYQIYGLNAWGHHLTSILFHAASALLLFFVLARMTGSLWPAALTSALFAVHPLHVESVAWISERKDVVSAFFWMLAMGAYGRYARRPNFARYLLVAFLLVLGLMAKPMVITLPWVFLLLDFWPLGRVIPLGSGSAVPSRAELGSVFRRIALLVLEKTPLFGLAIADCVYSLVMLKQSVDLASAKQESAATRLLNAICAYADYLKRTVWPGGMAPYYPSPEGIPPALKVAGSLLLLAAITGVAVFFWRRRPYLLVGWGWYLATLLPVIGLVHPPVGFNYSDRYTYLPLIGVFMMAAWTLGDCGSRAGDRGSPAKRSFALKCSVSALVLAVLSAASVVQIGYWHDSVALFTHALAVTGDNPIANNNLGLALAELGKKEEALVYHERAANDPRCVTPIVHNNLATAYAEAGRIDDAIVQYERALEIDPQCAQTHNNIAVLYLGRGKFEQAIAHYEEALRLNSGYVEARLNLGGALARLGKTSEAAGHFREAVRQAPDDFRTHYNLATALAALGKIGEAEAEYLKVVELDPNNVDALVNLGVAKCIQGEFDNALAFYTKAIEIDPGNDKALKDVERIRHVLEQAPPGGEIERYKARIALDPTDDRPRLDLAKLLVAAGRIDEAIEQYRAIVAGHPDHSDAYFNLGVLSNAQGKREEAVAYLAKVLEIAPGDDAARQLLDKIASMPPDPLPDKTD